MLTVSCPGCTAKLTVAENLLGKAVRCPACALKFRVAAHPAPTAPATPPPDAPVIPDIFEDPEPPPPTTISQLPAKPTSELSGADVSTDSDVPLAVAPKQFDFLAPPQQPGELGRLGHFRILKLLGKGGMGLVFQAEDTSLERLVALKVMHPTTARDIEAKQRFLRECRAMAALKHDHIVTIYQVGQEQGLPFLAMEYLEGVSLEGWLKKNTARLGHILRVGREATQGLAAAHARGLIHRDIKPDNLWLEAPAGRVKVLDFGLAHTQQSAADGLTQTGRVLGTIGYLAPEQAEGGQVDGRTDLFGLGCVLYRMCTGTLPFPNHSVMAYVSALVIDEPKSVLHFNPTLPQGLADLIEQLLAKKPSDRPGSAQIVVQVLRDIQQRCSPGPSAAPMAAPQVSSARIPRPVHLANHPAFATEFLAAEWALSLRGLVEVRQEADGKLLTAVRLSQLPGDPFQIVSLMLAGCAVTDAALESVSKLGHLITLDLTGTRVTDAGLRQVRCVRTLQTLSLVGTAISDLGLHVCRDLPKLRELYLRGTQVTSAGVEAFKRSRPTCQVIF
jgi:serine/threonine protein kinase